MYFDLNLPVSKLPSSGNTSKKTKEPQGAITFSALEIASFEKRLDLLIHLGYTVIAFSQTVKKRIDPKTHVNILNSLLDRLRARPGIVFLKRLNIILDQDSEKGFGLINANVSLFNSYDLISLIPTTHACFTLACLTHSLPSNLTAHIISLPLTLPRLPYHLKHTVVRTAIKNGAVFEINYVGAIGGENDPLIVDANVAESGSNAKRNWWAMARELVRVTKGKGLLVSGGVFAEVDHRAPRDIANLITMLGLSHETAHDTLTKTPKSLVVRAQTRMTYRAVLSEPTVVFPQIPESEIGVAGTSGTESHQGPLNDSLSAKRPHEPDNSRMIVDLASGSKKKKRKRNKGETDS